METVDARLESGRVRFYLCGQALKNNTPCELKKGGKWLTGWFCATTNPIGAKFLIDREIGTPQVVPLSEKSLLRRTDAPKDLREGSPDFGELLRRHYDTRPMPHITATLTNGKVALYLLGKKVPFGDKLELNYRNTWITGRIQFEQSGGVIVFNSPKKKLRVGTLQNYRWPEKAKS